MAAYRPISIYRGKGASPLLPGYRFYLVSVPNHPQERIIEGFCAWMRSVASARITSTAVQPKGRFLRI